MIHDLQTQKESIEAVIQQREKRILDHKLSISAEKALIRADKNTLEVIEGLIVKIGLSSEKSTTIDSAATVIQES